MSAAIIELEQWPTHLEHALKTCTIFRRVTVLRETDSTQDAAQRMNAQPGDVIVAGRQTRGRGRLGRAWIDDAGEGVAATLVTARGEPERLAIAAAVGVARAVEPLLQRRVGIKWPNDIVIDGRKLAGILIEQVDTRALIGVGINVQQRHWPTPIASRAVSLHQAGCEVDRLAVLEAMLLHLDAALRENADVATREFRSRDALTGSIATLAHDGRTYRGEILCIDSNRGLQVRTDLGDIWLPAAMTSTVQDDDVMPRPCNR